MFRVGSTRKTGKNNHYHEEKEKKSWKYYQFLMSERICSENKPVTLPDPRLLSQNRRDQALYAGVTVEKIMLNNGIFSSCVEH